MRSLPSLIRGSVMHFLVHFEPYIYPPKEEKGKQSNKEKKTANLTLSVIPETMIDDYMNF